MSGIRIQKPKRTRKRGSYQAPLEDLGAIAGGSSALIESVEDLLEEIDRALHDAGQA